MHTKLFNTKRPLANILQLTDLKSLKVTRHTGMITPGNKKGMYADRVTNTFEGSTYGAGK